jgi:undecaprenyl-diphosphatase
LAKLFFGRERPSEVSSLVQVSGYSYPSGHSLAASAFYLLLMVLAFRRYRTLHARMFFGGCALLLIGGVCFSRVYLGVHYPSDVVAGALLGAAWTCFLTVFFARWQSARAAEEGAR